ncbi:MAG: hypothetical protein IH874_07950 [Candidatus Dadabacteria bacterium]|nr:hypothetical protein [Candidatus Dadabacteria bacterium]
MEIVGKLVLMVLLIGALGLGVSEIVVRDVSDVDIPFKPVKDNSDNQSIKDYKKVLSMEAKQRTTVVEVDDSIQVPDTLWNQDADVQYTTEVKNKTTVSVAQKLADANSITELRSKMLLWHKKYHSALRSDKNRQIDVALQNYKNHKEALEIKQY